jgi:phage terminase small subunit
MPALDNAKHERFAQEYLVDLNASAAYARAYPDAAPPTAEANGSRLLGNAKVQTRVAELQAERAERVHVSQDEVLRELLRLGLSDVTNFTIDEQGHPELKPGVPSEAWRAVASVEHEITSRGDFTIHKVKLRLWDKNKALGMLGQHLGLFPSKVEHSGPGGGPIPFETLSPEERAKRVGKILSLAEARKRKAG